MDTRIVILLLTVVLPGGLALAEPPASKPAADPQVPFEARAVQRLELFRGPQPKESEMTNAAAGTLVTVSSLIGEAKWQDRPEQVVEVKLDGQSTYYALLSRLEPLKEGAVVLSARAGELLFAQVPAARRKWCEQSARRLQLSASGPQVLLYSAAADDGCAGYMAIASGTGKAAKVLARTRRGPLQSVTFHEFKEGPAVLDFEESLQGSATVNGIRRTFLGLGKPALKELLAVEVRRDELGKERKRSVVAEVEVKPSEQGLDIEVRRTEMQVVLATGAESGHVRETKRYRYSGGKLSEASPAPAGAK